MPADRSDPYRVLGVEPAATAAEIRSAYRRLVRELHPDAEHEDAERLAAVLQAYQSLREPRHAPGEGRPRRPERRGESVEVRVHRDDRSSRTPPDIKAGPVRFRPSR